MLFYSEIFYFNQRTSREDDHWWISNFEEDLNGNFENTLYIPWTFKPVKFSVALNNIWPNETFITWVLRRISNFHFNGFIRRALFYLIKDLKHHGIIIFVFIKLSRNDKFFVLRLPLTFLISQVLNCNLSRNVFIFVKKEVKKKTWFSIKWLLV